MATLVNDGLERKAKLLNGESALPFKWVAIGVGLTAEGNDQTSLIDEILSGGGERAEAVCSYEADYKAKWEITFTFTSGFNVIEVGIFDQLAVGGTMLMRHLWGAARPVGNGDTLQLTLTETESRV
jgi:hypothetical protein